MFDIIAMQIEQNNFAVPPDVYNRMDEYRGFIKMMTYNILLLFLNIGFNLGKMRKDLDKNEENIKIYLGGNGAKFLKWISNIKDFKEIREDNQYELFIVGTKGIGIVDIVKKGFGIVRKCNAKLSCTIELVSEMKEQMVEGYIYSQVPNTSENGVIPYLQPEYVENNFHNVSRVDSLASENDSGSPEVAAINQNIEEHNTDPSTSETNASTLNNEQLEENSDESEDEDEENSDESGNEDEENSDESGDEDEENSDESGDEDEENSVNDDMNPNQNAEQAEETLSVSRSRVLSLVENRTRDTESLESPRDAFYKNIQQLRQILFVNEFNLSGNQEQTFQKISDIGKIIQIDTQNVCQNIIHAINNMKSN